MKEMTGSSYEVAFQLRWNDAALFPRLLDCLPPGWRAIPPRPGCRSYTLIRRFRAPETGQSRHDLLADSEPLATAADPEEILSSLEGDLQLYVAEHASPWIFLHAGVVSWNGRAILLPGQSYDGKSTLVAALLRAGATYYSDEYAVLDEDARVHPYPRRLSLRRVGHNPLRRLPEHFGSLAAVGPAPIALIGLFSYRPQPAQRIVRLSPGKALLNLLLHSVPVRRRQEAVIRLLSRLVVQVPVLQGERGDADAVAAWLLRTLETTRQGEPLPVLQPERGFSHALSPGTAGAFAGQGTPRRAGGL